MLAEALNKASLDHGDHGHCVVSTRRVATSEKDSDEEKWPRLLAACCGHPEDVQTRLTEGMEGLLKEYRLPVPTALSELLSEGLICSGDCAREKVSQSEM